MSADKQFFIAIYMNNLLIFDLDISRLVDM